MQAGRQHGLGGSNFLLCTSHTCLNQQGHEDTVIAVESGNVARVGISSNA